MTKNIKDIAWSHSMIKSYEGCPHAFYRERVVKDCKVDFNAPHFKWGNEVHKHMEDRLRLRKTLPSNVEHYEKWASSIDKIAADNNMTTLVELEMCLTPNLEPTDWFSKDSNKPSWFRCKGDVVLVNEASGMSLYVDWKTGKDHGDDGQAERCAAATMLWFPEVSEVATMFVYLEHDKQTTLSFKRSELGDMMQASLKSLNDIAMSYNANTWPKRSSFRCRFCSVKDCEFNEGR